MSEARLIHSLNVEQEARALAEHWRIDTERAALAGLLHDCAKGLSLAQMQGLALAGSLWLDKETWDSRTLIHAPVGAYLARQDYGANDPEILDAIRWHTTGRPGMSVLEKIIYLTDMTEPARAPFGSLQAIRAVVWDDLDKAMLLALRDCVAYVHKSNHPLHTHTLDALRWFEGRQ